MADLMTQLGLIFFASVVFMLLALRLKLPSVVGLLLAGAIIGPNALGLVTQTDYIYIFSEVGAILLLFFVGIKFSINRIANMGLRSFIIWLMKDGFVFIVVYEASLLLGLNEITSIVLASTLAISSTTFFIKLVEEKNIGGSPEANLIFVVLIIEDLLAVFLLAVYSGMASGSSQDGGAIFVSILKATLVLAVTSYVVLKRVMQAVFELLARWKSEEVVLFFSMSFAILLSFFASSIGLTPSIGAFLAGNLLSSVRGFSGRTQETLSKFSMLFSAFFFLSIGMLVSFDTMLANLGVIILLFALACAAIFLSTFASSYLLGYRWDSAIRAGLLILVIGEFSLLIATQARPLVAPFDIVSVVSALVFLTALSGGILVQFDKQISAAVERFVPARMRESGRNVSLYLSKVLAEFEPPGGSVYSTFAKEGRRAVLSLVLLLITGLCWVLVYILAQDIIPQYEFAVGIGALILTFLPFASLLYSMKKMLDSMARAFHKAMGENLALDDMAMLYSAEAFFLFIAAFAIPLAVSFLNLPRVFGLFFTAPLALAVLFIWNLAHIVRRIISRREFRHYERSRANFRAPYKHMIDEMRSINEPVYRGFRR